jgi:hypothetical protein
LSSPNHIQRKKESERASPCIGLFLSREINFAEALRICLVLLSQKVVYIFLPKPVNGKRNGISFLV